MVNYWNEDGGFDPDGGCVVRTGQTFVPDTQERLDLMPSCRFEHESIIAFPVSEGAEADEDGGTSTPEEPVSKVEKKSEPAKVVEEAHAEAAEVAAKAQAVIAQPVAAVADLKSAIPADANIFTVLMGVVAVAGGGAAWKFYSDHSKRKHEAEMARIEKQDSQPGECKAHGVMKAEIAGISAKIDGVAAKVDALEKDANERRLTMGDWNVDDFSERMEKLEKKVKKLKKASDAED